MTLKDQILNINAVYSEIRLPNTYHNVLQMQGK